MDAILSSVCCDWLNQSAGTPVGRAVYRVRTVMKCSITREHMIAMERDRRCPECGLDIRDLKMIRSPRWGWGGDIDRGIEDQLYDLYLNEERGRDG